MFSSIEYQDHDLAINGNCTIPVHPVIKRTDDTSLSDDEKSPSCVKTSKNYYPDCFKDYKDAFLECSSDSDCIGIIKLYSDQNEMKIRHAPDGYYLCRHHFTISQNFFDKDIGETKTRPKEVYKKKSGKGMSGIFKFFLDNCLFNAISFKYHAL